MFHRVKSETAVKENEVQNETADLLEQQAQEQAEAAANAAQRAQNASAAADAVETEAPAEEAAVEETAAAPAAEETPASPAQSLYQRTAARPASYAPRSASFAAQNASPVVSSPASRQPAAASATENDRRLTIGRGITMSGEIESCDELQVEGTVEAALKGAKYLNIAESGVFYGTVEIEDAIIAGRFEGEIIVNGRLTVEETGIITGSISYKELEIKSGAIVDGRVTPLAAKA